ncbi:MAG: tetratricopeptide repeat protein [Planctomycetota bacterium]|jgi:predicted TPR repeat methyltransferase
MSRKTKRKKQNVKLRRHRSSKKAVALPRKVSAGIDNALDAAFRYHQDGQLGKAERIYKEILAKDPSHPDALHFLGLVTAQTGRKDLGENLMRKAIQVLPHNAVYYHNLATLIKDQEKWDEAIVLYQKAVALQPDYSDAWRNLGLTLYSQNRVDDAIASYRKVTEINPTDAEAFLELGNLFEERGDLNEAISCFRQTIQLQPDFIAAHNNMGNALEKLGKLDDAIACFQRVVELDPTHSSAKHHLSALSGQTTDTAPMEYVKELFDRYASSFDQHLVKQLEYEIPNLLRRSFNDLVKTGLCFQNVIDLGCGTGLSGEEFRSISNCLTGVDISPRMVEEAREKGIYDVLHAGDMLEFLQGTAEKFDLFVATDVFVYVGNLEPIFAAIQSCSARNAYFAFSTESCKGDSYILRPTGRYAHSLPYIQLLAVQHCFVIEMNPATVIRRQEQERIMGNCFVLKYVG